MNTEAITLNMMSIKLIAIVLNVANFSAVRILHIGAHVIMNIVQK